MKNKTQEKLMKISKPIVQSMTYMIKNHMYIAEYPGEQPTKKNMVRTIRRTYKNLYPSLFKTKEQYNMIENYVFDRLSRNGVLKYMRPIA